MNEPGGSPLISIIMPVYNAERFVAEAIESVLAQTLTDWELIIVDDGSTDATPGVLKRYADPRILMIRQENKGEGSARNTGLDVARGSYIGFLDADDMYLPDALASLSDYLSAHASVGVVYSDALICNSQMRPLMRLTEHRPACPEGNILEFVVLTSSIIVVPACTMARRETIQGAQLHFDPSLVIGTDWDFWIQIARVARFGYLNKVTCKYRIHGNNITTTVGQARRRKALALGRAKVLSAQWFSELSPETRFSFFYDFILNLLSDKFEAQDAVISDEKFAELSREMQATIHRNRAASLCLARGPKEVIGRSLRKAVDLNPDDSKTQALLWLWHRNPALGRSALLGWRAALQGLKGIRRLAKPEPKPLPFRSGGTTA